MRKEKRRRQYLHSKFYIIGSLEEEEREKEGKEEKEKRKKNSLDRFECKLNASLIHSLIHLAGSVKFVFLLHFERIRREDHDRLKSK